ncbi:hypothetical protein PVK06_027418 [Gossypium arboreum]|uniref:Uncharacterized protein n=1 Tax=Gossypium arboreum TaxID=29729 RepID=A0ABR0P1I3_GOSAR|nr:hypothetical protein PVK06_027418 [Gossypium arboreum]
MDGVEARLFHYGKGIFKAQVQGQPIETDPATTKKETKKPEEEIKKTKSVNFATDSEDEEEANPTHAPPVDSIVVVPPPFTEPMTEQDREIKWIIDEITKSNDEQEDMPLQSLKRKMRYKHSVCKSTYMIE